VDHQPRKIYKDLEFRRAKETTKTFLFGRNSRSFDYAFADPRVLLAGRLVGK